MDFVEAYFPMCFLASPIAKVALKTPYYSIATKVFDSIEDNYQGKNITQIPCGHGFHFLL
jgi:hypothetical protein